LAKLSRKPVVRREHQLFRGRLPVEAEIALALELNRRLDLGVAQRRLEPGAGQDFQRIGIEIGGEILGAARIRFAEQRM